MPETEFIQLLDRHRGILFKVSWAYAHTPEEREELQQEIVAALWASLHRYDRALPFGTWMYRVALNVGISQGRKRVHRALVTADPVLVGRAADAGRNAEQLAEIHQLYAAIGGLAEVDRALMLLSLDGYEHAEIAELTELSVSNVGTRLDRARTWLREQLNPKGAS